MSCQGQRCSNAAELLKRLTPRLSREATSQANLELKGGSKLEKPLQPPRRARKTSPATFTTLLDSVARENAVLKSSVNSWVKVLPASSTAHCSA